MALIDREAVQWVVGLVGGVARQVAVAVLRHVADALRDEEEILSGTVSSEAVGASAPSPAGSDVAPAPAPPTPATSAPTAAPSTPATSAPASAAEPSPASKPAPSAEAPPAASTPVLADLHDRVIDTLHTIFDPEIPVDIYELGLIYGVEVRPDATVHVRMTLTSPSCPAAQSLPNEVEEKVGALDDVAGVEVEVVFDPPWTPDLMSEEAKLELNLL